MNKLNSTFVLFILTSATLLSACASTPPTPDEAATAAAVEQTVVAGVTQTAEVIPTNTPIPEATDTPEPTATPTTVPTATETPIPTVTSTPTPSIIYGQVNVCFKSGEGVRSGVGLAVTLGNSEGKSPPGYTIDATASKVTGFTNRCKLLEKIPPGLYRVAGIGVLSQSAMATGSRDDVEVFPDETTEIEILVEKVE